jgi:Transposase.
MKASKFSDAQKAFILKQGADGIPVAEICRRAGISQATYFNWKKKYGRAAADGDEAAEAVGGRERQASEAGGRPVARQGDAAGCDPPKTVRPVICPRDGSSLNVSAMTASGPVRAASLVWVAGPPARMPG